jgi:hypothetical protein
MVHWNQLGESGVLLQGGMCYHVSKKPGLLSSDPASYCPIFNLSVVSELLECLVDKQLVSLAIRME